MQKTSNNKNKLLAVIILILLLILILAAILVCQLKPWQTSDDTTAPPANNEQTNKLSKEFCFEHEKMCLNYPENWKVTNFSKDDSSNEYPGHRQEVAVFSSPDEFINLKVHVGAFGDAGLCDEPGGTINFMDKTAISLDKLTANQTNSPNYTQLHAVSLVTNNLSWQENASADVKFFRSNWLEQAKLPTEKPYCEAMPNGNETMINNTAGVTTAGIIIAPINNFESPAYPFTFSSTAEAEKFLQKPDVKITQQILASVHYK